jgi:hypothetical protein
MTKKISCRSLHRILTEHPQVFHNGANWLSWAYFKLDCCKHEAATNHSVPLTALDAFAAAPYA